MHTCPSARSRDPVRLKSILVLMAAVPILAACSRAGDSREAAPAAAASPESRAEERARMIELGRQNPTAWTLFETLKKQANGGRPLDPAKLPDWSGVYTRTKGGTAFDPDGPTQGEMPATAKWTPEYRAKVEKAVADRKAGIEYDPLSQCVAPGHPRWLTLPFLRDFIVTPHQTTMIAEAFNSVRRIYTDGRDHPPVEERYETENGDSIGFWDGDKLVVHTNMLMPHMYERAQGFYSEQVETVEIWREVDDRTIEADVWVYDPPALQEPWYTKQSYTKLSDPDIRIRYWACKGNPNNDVYETPDGGSQFKDFTFTSLDDAPAKNAPAKGGSAQ